MELPSEAQLAEMYEDALKKQVEKGPKGEKASIVRSVVRRIVTAMKQKGITELSQASLRTAVIDALSTKDENGKSKKDYKLDQSHFTSIIAATYNVRREGDSVIVLVENEKEPKEKKIRKKKEV